MDHEKTNSFFFRFEDLRIYHKALDYTCWVKNISKDFQGESEFCKQIICVAKAIAVNIAEGSGRNKTQFIYYLKMAKSSIRESIVLSTLAHRLGYFNDEQLEESRQYLIEMTKMVGALISSLQRSFKANEQHEEDDNDLIDGLNDDKH